MRTAMELLITFRLTLRYFGIPLDQPTTLLCDNDAACKNARHPESKLTKNHNQANFHKSREAVAALIIRVAYEDSPTNILDLFTKVKSAIERKRLLFKFTYKVTSNHKFKVSTSAK